MRRVLIASHGKLASGIQNSIKILTGMDEMIETIDAYVDETDYTEKLEAFVKKVNAEDEVFIFTDLYGGSVNQKVMVMVAEFKEKNIRVITGMNLPIVLSILLEPASIVDDHLQNLINESQVTIVSKQFDKKDDEDFFE